MSQDPLKSFKIGDRQPPKISAGQRGAASGRPAAQAHAATATSPAAEATSGGTRFERLEEALDQEDPRDLGTRLAKMLTDLEAYAQGHNSARDRAAAKHARQAIERTIDLLDHLFKVREALAADSLQQVEQAQSAAKAGDGRGAGASATGPGASR